MNEQPAIQNVGTRIKVCGMTRIDQLHQLDDMGVELAGMIFYPKSPRFVLNHLQGADVKHEKLKLSKVGVFVNASFEEVMKQVEDFGLDMVQLHGDESPYFCEQVGKQVPVVKAFRIAEEVLTTELEAFFPNNQMFLFDASGAGYGGTGKKFNWKTLVGGKINKPFFLSGGIGPQDVETIRTFMQDEVAKDLFAVDINSCFETEPGVKDMNAVETFVKALNNE